MVPDVLIEEAARRFGLLADPTRLRILHQLMEGEASPSVIAQHSGLSLPNVSQHLSRLAAAGLVARRRDGVNVYYRVDDPTLATLCELVCAGVRSRAAALANV